MRIAINGFGRIGRNVLRAAYESRRTDIDIVAINDLGPVESNAHLLRFDSVHGRFPAGITTRGRQICIEDSAFDVFSEREPEKLPWADLGIDVVMECTGRFTARDDAARHLEAGARRVLVSAPSSGADRTVVYGVNHTSLVPEDRVVSNASCTTNCLSPIARVLHDAIGIERGLMTTIHSYTGDQPTLDTLHSDLYRSRAAALSMIPTSTGAARAVGMVLPDLNGRIDGMAIRVPTPNVSLVDFKFVAGRETTVERVNEAIRSAADGGLAGILGYTTEPNVSVDFNHDPRSSIAHLEKTTVMDGSLVSILSWYDNEWGFSNRMCDTAAVMGAL